MASDYCTAELLRSNLGIADLEDDSLIDSAISAASRDVDSYCGRAFWQDAEAVVREVFAASATCVDLLDQPGEMPAREISTTTGLIVKTDDGTGAFATTLTIGTDFLLYPRNAAADGCAFSEIQLIGGAGFTRSSYGRPTVQITAQFGWPTIDPRVERATLLQAAQLFKSKDAAFGIASFGDAGQMRVSGGILNPQAARQLAGLQIVPVG